MSTLKTTNIQHASAASAAITLASDGTAAATLSSLNGGPLSGARNRIINGAMEIDQRNAGSSVTINSSSSFAYCTDRFAASCDQATGAFTGQRSTVAPAGFINSLLFTVTNTTAPGSSNRVSFRQIIEGSNIADLAWGSASAKTVTLSFWVRSSLTGTYGVGLINSAENRSYVSTYSISSANTWEYKTLTVPGDTSGTWLTTTGNGIRLTFDLGSGSTYNASSAGTWVAQEACRTSSCVNWQQNSGATFYITGVQLEAGSVATPFERRSYGQELALCQRYYYAITAPSNSAGVFLGTAGQTTSIFYIGSHPVTMRDSPTFTISAASDFVISDGAAGVNPSTLLLNDATKSTFRLVASPSSARTQFRPYMLEFNATANAALRFSAEL